MAKYFLVNSPMESMMKSDGEGGGEATGEAIGEAEQLCSSGARLLVVEGGFGMMFKTQP